MLMYKDYELFNDLGKNGEEEIFTDRHPGIELVRGLIFKCTLIVVFKYRWMNLNFCDKSVWDQETISCHRS